MGAVPPKFWRWREFESREALAEALSDAVAVGLGEAINSEGKALLAVSGGATPRSFFNALSRAVLPWNSVVVTLCDERFVPPSSPRSNEALVRAELLREQAKAARFVPLFHNVPSAEQAAAISDDILGELPQPIDVAVLGMGLDGHTASFFPDARKLAQALDPNALTDVAAIDAPSAGEPRLTLTLPMITTAWRVFLHIEGVEKRKTFEHAMATEPALPIRVVVTEVMNESHMPVEVFWAP